MSSDTTPEAAQTPRRDWTVDPETGKSNSSPTYNEVVGTVEDILRQSRHDLMDGNFEQVSRMLVARLAGDHSLGPLEATIPA